MTDRAAPGDPSRITSPITVDFVAEHVRAALDGGDLSSFEHLLSPDAHGGHRAMRIHRARTAPKC
ncbi:MAG TPA: hypothetical protein VIX84_04145 [Acidimicrobiales bacterium]